MQGLVAALVSTLATPGGHFKSVDQTAGRNAHARPSERGEAPGLAGTDLTETESTVRPRLERNSKGIARGSPRPPH